MLLGPIKSPTEGDALPPTPLEVFMTQRRDDVRLGMAFRLCTSRRPTAAELDVLVGRLESLRNQYTAAPDEARKFLTVGESERDEELDATEHQKPAGCPWFTRPTRRYPRACLPPFVESHGWKP